MAGNIHTGPGDQAGIGDFGDGDPEQEKTGDERHTPEGRDKDEADTETSPSEATQTTDDTAGVEQPTEETGPSTGETDEIEYPEPPERPFEWSDGPIELPSGLTLYGNAESHSFPGEREPYLRENALGFVVDGIEAFLDEYSIRELSIPRYYSHLEDEFRPFVGEVTAESQGIGYGLTPRDLEILIRGATGKGGYSPDDLTLIGCEQRKMVLRAPEGDFVLRASNINTLPDEHSPQTVEIAGIDVPEASEKLRSGIKTLDDLLDDLLDEYADVELTEHDEINDGGHYFVCSDGDRLRITGANLMKLADMSTHRETLYDSYNYEDPWEEQFSVEVGPEDIPYDIGEVVHDSPVVGYHVAWSDPRRSSRASLSGRVKCRIKQYRLEIRDKDDSDKKRVRIRSRDSTAFEARPEKKEYDPLATPTSRS